MTKEISNGLIPNTQFLKHKSGGALDSWGKIIGIALIINCFIPSNKEGITIGVWLLPALSGVLLFVLPILSKGVFRGVAISMVGLILFVCYATVRLYACGEVHYYGHNLLVVFGILTFVLMLAGAYLRTSYIKSDAARLLGGIAAMVFLAIMAMQIIQIISVTSIYHLVLWPFDPFGEERLGFANALTWIIYIICFPEMIASAVLSIINLKEFKSSKTIANVSFKIGLISVIFIGGWTLLREIVVYLKSNGAESVWDLFVRYRLFFIIGSLLFMLGAGTVDWIRRLMPNSGNAIPTSSFSSADKPAVGVN
jgi:hypothetical protein